MDIKSHNEQKGKFTEYLRPLTVYLKSDLKTKKIKTCMTNVFADLDGIT